MAASILRLVPSKGFFYDYVQYASALTDAPEIYHVISALAVFSAVTSNYVEIRYPTRAPDGRTLETWSPMHLWFLIVGPSGDRKSTSMNLAVETAKNVIQEQIAGVGSTPESTFDFVGHKPHAFFFYPEGVSLFTMFNASYWQHGQGIFCDLYDGREDYVRQLTGTRTKSNPSPDPVEIHVRRPRVSLLTGIAVEHLDNIRRTDWTGGLIGRMALVYDERTRLIDTPGLKDEVGRLKLESQLQKLRNTLTSLSKPLQMGAQPAAIDVYSAWSRKLDAKVVERPAKVRSLFNRLPNHILRIAAAYAVSQMYNEIDVNSMMAAIRLGEVIEQSISRVCDLLADDPIQRNAVRVLDIVRRSPTGSVKAADLIDQTRLSYVTLTPAIKSLIAAGYVILSASASTGENYIRLNAAKK